MHIPVYDAWLEIVLSWLNNNVHLQTTFQPPSIVKGHVMRNVL